jgi:hypothetical protein
MVVLLVLFGSISLPGSVLLRLLLPWLRWRVWLLPVVVNTVSSARSLSERVFRY